jgi:hypothetical protein
MAAAASFAASMTKLPALELSGTVPFMDDGKAYADVALSEENDRLAARLFDLIEVLEQIVAWSEGYPAAVFPEPDFERADALLRAGGMTPASIGSSNIRDAIEGVGAIARGALGRIRAGFPLDCG